MCVVTYASRCSRFGLGAVVFAVPVKPPSRAPKGLLASLQRQARSSLCVLSTSFNLSCCNRCPYSNSCATSYTIHENQTCMHLVRHKLGTQRALALLSLSFLCGYLLSCCLLELLTCTSSPGIGIENDSERQYRSTLLKPTDLLVLVWLDPIRVKEVPPAEHCGAFTHGHIEKSFAEPL